MSTHTPGPWTVVRQQSRWDDGTYPEVVGFRVSGAVYRQSPDVVEANARLMAAAPEMRTLLAAAVKALEEDGLLVYSAVYGGENEHETVALLRQAHALLDRLQ